MNLRIALVLAVAALGAASCGVAQCAAVCTGRIKLTVVDGSGAAVTPTSGSITFSGSTQTFDCTGTADAGTGSTVTCSGNTVTVNAVGAEPATATASISGGGKSFSGSVSLTWAKNGQSICGSDCSDATGTVTVQ